MALTADELAYARSWIGELETDAIFTARVDRLDASYEDHVQAVDAAIEESIRARIAVLTLDQPSQMSIPGVSVGWGANIQALQKTLSDFVHTKGSGVYGVTYLERPDIR